MRVNQKQNAINHVQNSFYFSAKISMPWGINNVNLYPIMHNGSILCQNGNSSFTFKWIGVHYSFSNLLVFTENMALFKHCINQCGLTMVYMGNDSDISDIFSNHSFYFPLEMSKNLQHALLIITLLAQGEYPLF